MSTIDGVARVMQTILTTEADEAAREAGFAIRRSKLTGALFAQTLVLGWLSNPDATLEELSQTALAAGLKVTPQGLDQRFGPAAAEMMLKVLEAAVGTLVKGDSSNLPVLRRFEGVYVLDSTTISLPEALGEVWSGCGGSTSSSGKAAVKAQVMFNLAAGSLAGPELQAGRAQDKASGLQKAHLPRRALRITDLGYFSLLRFAEIHDAGVYWLSRLHVQAAVHDPDGRRLELETFLKKVRVNQIDVPVLVGTQTRVGCRLAGVRVPRHVAAERRRKLCAEARRERRAVSKRRLGLAGWTLMLTNAPSELLSVDEAVALYRARWQIEMLFKLWKSHGKIDSSRSQKPWRILCEVYAKLVAMVIQHWVLITSCWAYPDRSLAKASATVRRAAIMIVWSFNSITGLVHALNTIRQCLTTGCRINRRRKDPAAFQVLQPFPQNALEAIAVA